MKTIFRIAIFILINNVAFSQVNFSAKDTIEKINKLLDELPKVKNFGGDIKHKIEYNKSTNEIKLFSFHYDNKTLEKTNEYNIVKFNCEDIDPNAVVIKPYSNHSIMLQLIAKNNHLKISSLLIYNEQVKSAVEIDRASIAFYPIEFKSKLEQLKNIFIHFLSPYSKIHLQSIKPILVPLE